MICPPGATVSEPALSVARTGPTSSTPLADTVTARPVKSSTHELPTVKDCVIEHAPDAGQPGSCAVIWAAVHAVSAWAGRTLPMVRNKAAHRTTPGLLRRTEDMSPLLPGALYGCVGNVQEVQPHGNRRKHPGRRCTRRIGSRDRAARGAPH